MDGENENGILDDSQWNNEINVFIRHDERLTSAQKAIIEGHFGMVDGRLQIPCRQVLVKYVLQRYQIDPKNMDPKPKAQQIVVENLKELKPWLYD